MLQLLQGYCISALHSGLSHYHHNAAHPACELVAAELWQIACMCDKGNLLLREQS
jgi:hypothetical protein